MVSNSLASWANSSSGSGSSRSLTEPIVTVTSASLPACGPAASSVVNSFDSPADRPTIASSRPSMSWPEPTSCDRPFGRRLGNVFAVDGGRQVDRDEVAGRSRPLDAGQGAEPGAQRLQFGVHFLVADVDRVDGDLQRAQVGQGELRPHIDLGGEHQLLAVLLLRDLDLGLTERLDVGLGDGLAVAARQCLVDDLVEHRLTTDTRLQQLGRRLARPETRQPHLLGQLLVGPVEVRLQLRERHLYVDANPGRAQLLDGALHACTPRLC